MSPLASPIPRRELGNGISLRLIQAGDATALRHFEIENRAWFERYIATRGHYFYLPEGIAAHIQLCLSELALGRMQPMVLADDSGAILGRCNLHQIDLDEAKLGYRLASKHTGRGLAYAAARELVADAQHIWRLPQLRSFVIPDNAPSVHILRKLGFARQGQAEKATLLQQGEVYSDNYLLRF